MAHVINLDAERAARALGWIAWCEERPPADVVFMVKLTFADRACADRYIRRGDQVFVVEVGSKLVKVADRLDGTKYAPQWWRRA